MREYKGRFLIATILVANVFLILVGRMWYLQILRGDEFERFSIDNRVRSIRIPAPRGKILDRRGREVVVNRPSFDLYILPEDIKNPDALSSVLSPILAIDASTIN
ncbi:MAG TPA: penicillin-binding protein 2, partial [Thermodesulfobacteriota bacterium]